MPAPPETAGARTRWTIVLLGVLAGIMVAFQIGKLPAAIPALQQALGLDLVEAGWVLALIHAMAAATGAVVGVHADRWGIRRVALIGLLSTGLGAAVGGLAPGLPLLLFSRVLEGVGSVTVLVSAPGLILRASRPGDQGLAMGMWGTFMPTGMAIMTLLTPPLLALAGWRGLWFVNAGLVWLFAGLFWAGTRAVPDAAAPRRDSRAAGPGPWAELADVLRRPGPWLLTLVMGLYAATYLPILGFLPKYLIEQHGYAPATAALLVALAIWANAPGNLAGGWLGQRGVPRWLSMIVALATMGVTGWLVYGPGFDAGTRLAFVFAFSFFAGLLPASIFGSVTRHAPDPGRVAGVNGLIQQASNVGQLATPPLFAMLVAAGGWPQGPLLTVALTATAIFFALLLRRLERAH